LEAVGDEMINNFLEEERGKSG